MFRKKTRRLIVFLCAAMLVWSQLAVAAYACPQDVSFATPSVAATADMPPDCAGEMNTKPAPLCKAHCDQSPQSSQTPSIDIPPLALVSVVAVSLLDAFERRPARVLHSRAVWLTDASPPLRIQYQVFRN